MTVIYRSRRQFLRGAGGFALALPWLPSLLTRTAHAQTYQAAPRFVAIATPHGAVTPANFYPQESLLTASMDLYSDHKVRSGALKLNVSGGRSSLSTVMTGSSSVFTDQLASKMNVMRGLDVSFYLGHHTGGHLGNYARNDGGLLSNDQRPTIDQVMAWSPSFYKDLANIKQRSMHIGIDGGFAISWGYSNPQAQSGNIQSIPTSFSSKELFDSIFVPAATAGGSRVPVVDRVLDSYRQLRGGAFGDARRLSAADRQRLDDHLARLAELERRVNVVASCGDLQPPAREVSKSSPGFYTQSVNNIDASTEYYQTYNDVIAAAFMCGTSRIATIYSVEQWSTFAGDWHQEVAHQAQNNPGRQQTLTEAYQKEFENVVLDLVSKLDVEEAEGKTYLDNTLVAWSQESGESTHDPVGIPVVTFGSAAGFLKTGQFVDFRGMNPQRRWSEQYTGILYNQWLATMLQAMGVPPSEFERNGEKGYGAPELSDVYGPGKTLWPDRLRSDASKIVPVLKA